MNICIITGRVQKNAVARGSEPRALSFTVETRQGNGDSEKKERLAYVPCVLFNPSPEVETLLTTQGEGLVVELEGRVSGPNAEPNNSRRFSTEVIVRNKTLLIHEAAAVAA